MKLGNVPHRSSRPHQAPRRGRPNAFACHLRLHPSVYLQKIATWINSHPRTYYLLVLILSISQILLEV